MLPILWPRKDPVSVAPVHNVDASVAVVTFVFSHDFVVVVATVLTDVVTALRK